MTSDRTTRAAMYSQWLRDNADGLLYQLRGPVSIEETKILCEAHANVKAALELIEHRMKIQREEVA